MAVLEMQPNNFLAHFNLGEAYCNAVDFDKSIRENTILIEHDAYTWNASYINVRKLIYMPENTTRDLPTSTAISIPSVDGKRATMKPKESGNSSPQGAAWRGGEKLFRGLGLFRLQALHFFLWCDAERLEAFHAAHHVARTVVELVLSLGV